MLSTAHDIDGHGTESQAGTRRRTPRHPRLEQLICHAVCNEQYGALLVRCPAEALAQSPIGRLLSAKERSLVLSIDGAADIHEFAGILHARLQRAHAATRAAQEGGRGTRHVFGRTPAIWDEQPMAATTVHL